MTDYRIIPGDCIEGMRTLAAESVQCCVTSPPYWGLRDYGTAKWEGGEVGCDHLAPPRSSTIIRGSAANKSGPNQTEQFGTQFRDICGKCGARRIDAQIGLESTPEQYVARMVDVFREVRRVLRDDGTLWLNLGDSYNSGGEVGRHDARENNDPSTPGAYGKFFGTERQYSKRQTGLKPKDLCGIPWRVAFALQADGWWLRQDIVWHKPNPMPESVTDRCTKAHEYIFLLAKSERYHYDAAAIAEPAVTAGHVGGFTGYQATAMNRVASGNQIPENGRAYVRPETRNKRSVWSVGTDPYPEAHFATFPPALIEPCILAGCPVDGTVMDPFTGSGTTGAVALKHGRRFVGCELNPEYIKLAEKRIGAVVSEQALFRQESAA